MRLSGLVLGTALLGTTLVGAARAGDIVDGIAAQVGSDVVLVSEVNALATPVEEEMRKAGAPESEIAKMRAEALERLIERRLIGQVAKRAEIDASDSEIDEAIEAIASENHIRLEQLRASVEAQGLSFAAYRERIRRQIVHEKVVSGMVRSRVHVEESEVRQLYRERFADQPTEGAEVHLRQIFVPFSGDTPAAQREACVRVREARARLASGEPFSRVAAEVSAVNPERGGDLGWLHRDELARWMAHVVDGLKEGQTSDVVETSFACTVLELVARREVKPVRYEEAKDRLRSEVFDRKFETEYRHFIEKLRKQTFIDRKGLFAEAARLGWAPAGPGEEGEPTP